MKSEKEDDQVKRAIYQIYTEDLPRHRKAIVRALKSHGFPYCTIAGSADGYGPDQDGKPETAMMIWVAAERYSKTADKRMERAVKEIREKNGDQGSVLLVRIPAYHKLIRRPKRRRVLSVESCGCTARPTYEARPRMPGEGLSVPVPRPTQGRIMTVGGNWERLLPKNAELRGKIVRFLPEESVKGMVQNGSCPFPFRLNRRVNRERPRSRT